jgi:hypothetical protein
VVTFERAPMKATEGSAWPYRQRMEKLTWEDPSYEETGGSGV